MKTKVYPETPECDKIVEVKETTSTLTDFVDWLNSKGYKICQMEVYEGYPEDRDEDTYDKLTPITVSYEQLFADYLNIDLNKAEQERHAILEYIRSSQ